MVYSAYTTVTNNDDMEVTFIQSTLGFFIDLAQLSLELFEHCCFYGVKETSGQKMHSTVVSNVCPWNHWNVIDQSQSSIYIQSIFMKINKTHEGPYKKHVYVV